MKKILRNSLILALMAVSGALFAQQKQATISFNTESHDFGKIKEEAGDVTYKFEFTNTGGEVLVINDVKASCGCTTPGWSKEPIAPGAKGYVSAKYNPTNRPGKFTKTITVTSSSTEPTKILKISGEVIPKPKVVTDNYPQTMGSLRLKTNHVSFSKIKNTEVKVDTLPIMNESDAPLAVSFENIPSNIKISVEPSTLKPNEEGKIIVTYDAKAKNDWGFMIDRVYLLLDGKKDSKNMLSISATIEEDFSKLTPKELENAPYAEFDSEEHDFGTLKQGDVVEHDFILKNTGKSDLIIRKTKASCGCTAVNLGSTVIPAGKSTTIKAKFNSSGKSGKQSKTITVITNSPKNSSVTLRVKSNIEVPAE